MGFQYVPSGFTGTWSPKPIVKIIEKYIEDNWTEDDVPKKSEIKFGYLLNQNVGEDRKALALKCFDFGNEVLDKGTNYASCRIVYKTIIHVEGRKTMENVTGAEPDGFEEMKLKIITIINSDPLALRETEGIHKISAETTDPIIPMKDKQNWYSFDLNVTVTRFMSRVVTP